MNMYILGNKTASLIEKTTFSQLGKYESDIEEILRKNMDMVCDSDEESMLLVGQQVKSIKSNRRTECACTNNLSGGKIIR